MRIKSFLIVLFCSIGLLQAQEKISSPKLYLNIIVDQLRTDFLYEFSELYGVVSNVFLQGGVYILTPTMLLRMSIGLRLLPLWLRERILMLTVLWVNGGLTVLLCVQ